MKKLFTILACLLLYCNVAAKAPASVIVHTTTDESYIFSLTEKTRFEIADNSIKVIYPEGEYSVGLEDLKNIEYSATSDIQSVENNASYRISVNILTIEYASSNLEISLYSPGGVLAYYQKVMASESAIINFSGFKGIYILKINGISQKIILK
ncbi:MAG: hypothetical protein K2O00_07575 [Muribaculaceae bacterium]|nr:hypothetical protein [Muribaculaceae bacterium]